MSTIESEVLAAFLERIEASGKISSDVADGLQRMLIRDKLPSAEELARMITAGQGDALA
jgi:hypothetical protein